MAGAIDGFERPPPRNGAKMDIPELFAELKCQVMPCPGMPERRLRPLAHPHPPALQSCPPLHPLLELAQAPAGEHHAVGEKRIPWHADAEPTPLVHEADEGLRVLALHTLH